MTFVWTKHRFSGGTLVLDLANTVILRADPQRRRDRLADIGDINRFAEAASLWCEECREGPDFSGLPARAAARLLHLREVSDRYFRQIALGETLSSQSLGELACLCGDILADTSIAGDRIDGAAALSALKLAMDERQGRWAGRIKLCVNCGWLFIDRSRNRSRTWCDMTICGNRNKARRHYHRKRMEAAS
ncbi:MAG: CGNR zinc finger domain-containing protein [Rhizobiaceae bacterium]